VVTLFEYMPESHVKLSKIIALEDDLAMALQAVSIRILAPIPGTPVVGFEVANRIKESVRFADIVQSKEFQNNRGALPLILGQDPLGMNVIVDLASMPHLLIAGSTGSGKSVALNAMLVSLLCKFSPDELKLIIIDPKRLEFAAYQDIAHLIFPIVTDSRKAFPVLKWVVSTMEQRYEIMAAYGVRNIGEYHALRKDAQAPQMPFMVVIIDELADLMMTTGREIEETLARIAQMARAAGIHVIIATQRPSVDVITGIIKVNFTARISFKVTSKVDSRTILDDVGAEKLLGRGDMLFMHGNDPHIRRVHGAYITDQEIEFVVQSIKKQRAAQYLDLQNFLQQQQQDDILLENDDNLYKDIMSFVQDCDEISISLLQRQFRIGYNRSARIIAKLEADGIILPSDGGKMRRVLK
jgi:S-DNA-T family DNA segregation ATPase FtsK/SpoIIIE